MTANATLVSHVNTDRVSREQLARIPTPAATDSFRPVHHIELVETLERALHARSITIESEQFAVRRDGSMLFGTLALTVPSTLPSLPEGRAALGLRTSNDRTMSIQLCAGLNVFVCDNLAFRGDLIALRRKHTSGLNLFEELTGGVLRFEEHFGLLANGVKRLQEHTITDQTAKATIFDVFNLGVMPARLLPAVGREYFAAEPKHEEFAPRTAWSLHNAFTEVAKAMPISTRVPAIQEVGRYFGI